ncbi:hypothetical protein E4N62_22260 [Streptomyces sp. MNU76]|uniref:hypothetical protein n=1 Tax=Streptomyces sp. MNU76 TaxID=2560026 RepID=UPI001E6323D8|nr:hypothetical protein [Streptomyces sp. MNU76]MCC9707764.1 hypothetical protein [Streptomyces sp. MNU76]
MDAAPRPHHTAFRWGVHLPDGPTPEGVRRVGIDIGPLLREAAELSGHEDTYGMGSMRGFLPRTAR